jgi:membrane protein YdbS with pleckstrin-like domain
VLAVLILGVGTVWPEAYWGLAVPLVIVVAGFLTWLRAGHLVAEEALFVSGGIVTKRLWILPYEKLQTLSTSRTPLQRGLRLASLTPDTAGAVFFGAPEVEDLPLPDAQALAGRLLARFYSARIRVRKAALASLASPPPQA